MIKMHPSLLVAMKVLDLLLADPRADVFEASVKTFDNGREQGFRLEFTPKNVTPENYSRRICWAENRNSDDLVVYRQDAKMEILWDKGKYFAWTEEQLVVDYIFQLLEEELGEKSTFTP
ncbi:hypothetical protein D3C81_1248890 [compost metagenome]